MPDEFLDNLIRMNKDQHKEFIVQEISISRLCCVNIAYILSNYADLTV